MPEFQDFGSDRFIANEIEILKSYHLREELLIHFWIVLRLVMLKINSH